MAYLLSILIKYRYWALFPAAALEGPLVSLIVGFLIFSGYFSFLPAYFLLIWGDIIPDYIYYRIGFSGNKEKLLEKYGKRFSLISRNFGLVEKLWADHPWKLMFFSKLAYGLSIPFLITAGLVRMPYKKFFAYALPVTFFQYGVIMSIGYFLGNSYYLAGRYIKYVYLLIAVLIVLVLIIYNFVSKYAKHEIEKLETEEEHLNNE